MTAFNSEMLTGLTDKHLFKRDDGFMLHQQALQPFNRLQQAAAGDGIDIKIVSAFRSYQRQASIWQAKLSGARPVYNPLGQQVNMDSLSPMARLDAILLYSALPGGSRHHWGTELDVYDAAAVGADYQPRLEPAEYLTGGPFYKLQQWLIQHATDYNFFLPYQTYNGGVAHEPWHISYKPISSLFLAKLTPDILRETLIKHPIAEQELVLQHLPRIFSKYVSNICQ